MLTHRFQLNSMCVGNCLTNCFHLNLHTMGNHWKIDFKDPCIPRTVHISLRSAHFSEIIIQQYKRNPYHHNISANISLLMSFRLSNNLRTTHIFHFCQCFGTSP